MVPTCVRLGFWQLDRYDSSQATTHEIVSAWEKPPLTTLDPAADLNNRRAALTGAWVPRSSALASGGLVSGAPGYQLMTVLQVRGGPRVLVDRGWVPVEVTPDQLAALDVPGEVSVEGLLVRLEGRTDLEPEAHLDAVPRWPLETDLLWGVLPRAKGPPLAAIAAHTSPPVAPWALRAGPALEEGRERRLGSLPVGGYVLPVPKIHHLSYAAQWFAFALLGVIVWAWMCRVRSSGPSRATSGATP